MDEVENLIKNREPIDDIDKDDMENPQLVVEYVNEIYAYLRQLEIKQEIRPNYLKSKKVEKTTILPKVNLALKSRFAYCFTPQIPTFLLKISI